MADPVDMADFSHVFCMPKMQHAFLGYCAIRSASSPELQVNFVANLISSELQVNLVANLIKTVRPKKNELNKRLKKRRRWR